MPNLIAGLGTEDATLCQAGIAHASGIIAGSDNDVNNLSIAVTASELKPSLFVVARQSHNVNSPLFAAYGADFTMVPSHIVAQGCLAILTTPLLAAFLALLRERDEAWCSALGSRLQGLCHGLTPAVWGLRLNIATAPAAYHALMQCRTIKVGELLRREEQMILLPPDDFPLVAGDELLLACSLAARRNLELTLHNPSELAYVLTGSWVSPWFAALRKRRQP